MTTYTVTHAYASVRDGQRWGPWEEGARVDLNDADAAWVERDSPGTLVPAEQPEPTEPTEPAEEKPARQARRSPNRQHRGTANRSAG